MAQKPKHPLQHLVDQGVFDSLEELEMDQAVIALALQKVAEQKKAKGARKSYSVDITDEEREALRRQVQQELKKWR